MRKYKNPKLEELEKYYDEDFLKAVDDKLQLFLPTLEVHQYYGRYGIQVRYYFKNNVRNYIEINFIKDGLVELYHNYEDPDAEIEYEETARSTNVNEIADKFQEIISKIDIYS